MAVELVRVLEPAADESPLAAARVHRRLTREAAARRAGITVEEAEWLEDGRLYRFGSSDAAVLATLLYGTALGLENRDVRALAGLPVPVIGPKANPVGRLAVLALIAVALAAVLAYTVLPRREAGAPEPRGRPLPPTWKIAVDVLNGGGDIDYTRRVASQIGALAYHIRHVGRADRFDYPETAVYYEPGGAANAQRLARSLGAPVRPLPGGRDPDRLVVIVGPARGPS